MIEKLIPVLILTVGLYFAVSTLYEINSDGVTNVRMMMILLSIVLIARGVWQLKNFK